MSEHDCLFCKIVAGQIPSDRVFEDDVCFAFNDISPQAPTHILVIPRRHLESLSAARTEDRELLGRLLATAAEIAGAAKLDSWRLVANTGADAGQSVFHLHPHVLGGRRFSWPPG